MLHAVFAISAGVQSIQEFLQNLNDKGKEKFSTQPRRESLCKEDPKVLKRVMDNIFQNLFLSTGKMNMDYIKNALLTVHSCDEFLDLQDADHYNLLEKAVLYDDLEVAAVILDYAEKNAEMEMSLFLKGALHLASFLGSTNMVALMLKKCPKASEIPGNVRISMVMGPPGHKLRTERNVIARPKMPLPGQAGKGAPGKTPSTPAVIPPCNHRIHWIRHHREELPIYYAVCGDQAEVARLFDANLKRMFRNDHDARIHMLGVACSCASFRCLDYLYELIPTGIHTRDKHGWAVIHRGLSHGIAYIKFLQKHGADETLLNNMDGTSTTNALHVFFHRLDKNEWMLSKFKNVSKVTQMLVQCGVDINMASGAYKSHGLKDTPLHILLNQMNMILSTDGVYRPHSDLSELQTYYDMSLAKAVKIILKSGYDIEKNGTEIVDRLFSNRNYLLRFKLNTTVQVQDKGKQDYGLTNVLRLAHLFFREGVKVVVRRRSFTPLLKAIDNLHVEISPFSMFNSAHTSELFITSIQLLLENDVDPNTYPISRSTDSFMASPMIHFMDIFIEEFISKADLFEDPCIKMAKEVIKLLCNYKARFVCYMASNGVYIKHSICDSIVILLQAIESNENCVKRTRMVTVLLDLLVFLLHWGAETRFHEFAATKTADLGEVPSEVKYSLLYRALRIGTKSTANSRVIPLWEYGDFHKVLKCLFRMTSPHIAHKCVRQCTTDFMEAYTEALESPEEMSIDFESTFAKLDQVHGYLNEAKSLRNMCRRSIYTSLRTRCILKIDRLPLPSLIKAWLVVLDE